MGLKVEIPFVAKTIPMNKSDIVDPDIEKFFQETDDILDGKFLIEVLKNLKNRKANSGDTTLWLSSDAHSFFLQEIDYFFEYRGDLYVWESAEQPEIPIIFMKVISSLDYATFLHTKDGEIIVGMEFLEFLTPTDEIIEIIEKFYRGEEVKKRKNLKLVKGN